MLRGAGAGVLRRRRVGSAPPTHHPEHSALRALSPRGLPPRKRDRPNPPALRRDLCARAGVRSENSHCRRETPEAEGHGHHIRPRSEGGATALFSEVWLCRRCHSLVHSGSLAVRGDPLSGLEWTPRAMDLTEGVREELERTRSLPEVRVVARALSGHPDSSGRRSGHPDSPRHPDPSGHPDLSGHPDGRRRVPAPGDELREVMEDVIAGLRGLGWTKEEATTRVARAHERLRETPGEPIDVQTLLTRAVRG